MRMQTMLFTVALALASYATPGNATTALYTISGQGSGSLDGTAFDNAAFTFTLTGDTSNVSGNVLDPLTTAVVSIAGLGDATFTIPTRLGVASNTIVFFSRSGSIGGLDLFDFDTSAPVDLLTNFSVTGSNIFALNQFANVGTSVGDLTFNQSSNVLFSGRIGAIQAGVPEPGTWAMMLLGFGVVGGALRYRRKTTISYA